MLKPSDISDYKSLTGTQQKFLENQMQQDELNYLSSVSFEQFNITDADIRKLDALIDNKTKGGSGSFNTIFISVLCGLLIGISIFFVIFQKSKNHPSVYQLIEEEKFQKTLSNTVTQSDTLFPIIVNKPIEHYNTILEKTAESPSLIEQPEILPRKDLIQPLSENTDDEEIVFQFTANAPVIFIDNMKVTNYRMYYFKQTEAIDLSGNMGLAAQYGSKADIERVAMNNSNTYLAHKVIRKAMRLFKSKNIVNCIEELTILYNYNKNDANAQFYLGMSYYQLGKYQVAERFYQKNLDNVNNIFHQESEFYQALCLLNMKHNDEALKQLQIIVINKGFYSSRAQETLDKFSK
ncbi:MAG: CDC27 family protein [Burkholderiales bacterium]|nr:CDC27 family protein [Bacteroidia bacterium]